jgi:hypothetical protein
MRGSLAFTSRQRRTFETGVLSLKQGKANYYEATLDIS